MTIHSGSKTILLQVVFGVGLGGVLKTGPHKIFRTLEIGSFNILFGGHILTSNLKPRIKNDV